MTEYLYILTICLPLATVLIVFGMRYAASIQQTRAVLAQEDGSRSLAVRAVAAEAATAATLSSIHATLAEIAGRLMSIEKVLKEVE
jgi:hypothetical protein